MPLYDYECGKCAHKFELRKSFSEGASARCPVCDSMAKRVFAPVPIVFKGSGFYVTDYRKDHGTPENKPESKTECKTECKTDCKADKASGCSNPACKN